MIDLSGLGDAADVPREFAAWQRLLGDADPTVSRAVPRLELLDGGREPASVSLRRGQRAGHRR